MTFYKFVPSDCDDCGGLGTRPDSDPKMPLMCHTCRGSGQVTKKIPTMPPPSVAALANAESQASTPSGEPVSGPTVPTPSQPAGEPAHVVFYNPAEQVRLMPLSSVAVGEVWVVGAGGLLTKVGTPR